LILVAASCERPIRDQRTAFTACPIIHGFRGLASTHRRWNEAIPATLRALGAALAHLLELPNKINLPEREYFIVQQAYRGWNRLAYLLVIELISMLAIAGLSWHEPRVLWPTLAAIFCLLCAQAAFWTFTYPANAATDNWTAIPADWDSLRTRWEYSHALGAAFQVLATNALIIAALARAHPQT
jgi:hypothetical protein